MARALNNLSFGNHIESLRQRLARLKAGLDPPRAAITALCETSVACTTF